MHYYDFDLPSTLRFRELIAEYGWMRRLDGLTPHRRGQLFNDLIGDLIASANSLQASSDRMVPTFAARLDGAKLLRTYLTGTSLGTSVGVTAESFGKTLIDLVTFLLPELGGHAARTAGTGE